MIQGVGQDGGLAKAAIEAALASQARAAQTIREGVSGALQLGKDGAAPAVDRTDFANALMQGIRDVDASVRDTDQLPLDVVSGKIDDFAELAGRLKQSEMTFKFALEVRNKLIDAYRETMRMSV